MRSLPSRAGLRRGGGPLGVLQRLRRLRASEGLCLPEAPAEAFVKVELATSRYRDFDKRMGVPVRITLGRPRMLLAYDLLEEIRLLAPTPSEFKLRGDEFDKVYVARLEKIGVVRLRSIFEEMSERHGGRRLVLLCFENTLQGELCHRRMFARWWLDQTGEEVREIDPFSGEMVLY